VPHVALEKSLQGAPLSQSCLIRGPGMPLFGLVAEAHELPNQGFIHPVTLHYLGVRAVTAAELRAISLHERPLGARPVPCRLLFSARAPPIC